MSRLFFAKKSKRIFMHILFSLAISFVIFCTALAVVPYEKENTVNVFDSTVRLRVVANSDSDEDQTLKLAVRNDIIGLAHEIFKGCTDIDSARAAVNGNMDVLLDAAEKSVRNHGSDMPVKVSFVKESCPVRRYSEFTFPAGEYMTLRIDLGRGEGQNWWCVMYPPLCVSAAANDVYADIMTFKSYGFDEEQIEQLTGQRKPQIRFALAELFK